jgi:broad specificity phosphatase PhoE
MSEIYFIRHGQASFGAENYDRLSEKGVVQATILGNHLAGLGVKFDAVCSGEMERQEKTAQAMIRAYGEKKIFVPDLLVDPGFNEYDAGVVWETQTRMMLADDPGLLAELKQDPTDQKAFQRVFSTVMERWISGKFDPPGSVTWEEFKHRVVSGLTALVTTWGPSKKIAVFSSGGPISIVVQHALNLSDSMAVAMSWQVMNASITRIKYNSRTISLTGFNEIAHLELAGDTALLTYR